MADERPHCDHQVDVDDRTWFECELPMHHDGDHQYLYTWPNEPHGPKLPRTLPKNRLLPETWTKALEEALVRSLLEPVVARDKVVNRDLV